MTSVNFYHLTEKTLEQALPSLLDKTLQRGWRAVVMAGSKERAEALCQHLWTYRPDSFLPHGTAKDGHPADQPVWLTEIDERPNNAQVLFLTDGAYSENISAYERICDIFDGNDETAAEAARHRWRAYAAQGHEICYWQQTLNGWKNATTKPSEGEN